MNETAKDRGDDISVARPFNCINQTYDEVMQEVRDGTSRGLEFYKMMVAQLPWYKFEEENSVKSIY